ncbi:MAG: TolB family protein [Dehalococcoidia bacterium]
MSTNRPPRLALTDAAGRLRVLAVHEAETIVDVAPPLDAAQVEEGPLPRFCWPTWLADGRLLISVTTSAGRPGMYLLEPGSTGATLLYRPPPGRPAEIAPAVPHHANPSPDGRYIALATPGDPALTLMLVDVDLGGDPPEVARGMPIFTAWSPNSDSLLVHAGTVIQRMDRGAASALTTVGLNAVDLRVPAWSPDGQHFATVRHGEIRNAVVLLDRTGRHVARVGAVGGAAALAWSPDGGTLAVSSQSAVGSFEGIDLIDVRSSETRTLIRDRVLLWLWSPEGRRIAYLRRAGSEGQLAWRVLSLDGRPPISGAMFYPSPAFAVLVAFFDQYLLSHRLWSPDGRYLLAAGRIAVNGPPRELAGGSVLLFDTAGGRPLRPLCTGEIASWQPIGGH